MKNTTSILFIPTVSTVICFTFFLVIGNVESQWYPQNSGTTVQLYGVSFADINTGYVVGSYGVILKTTNGGLNWIRIVTGDSNFLYGVDFINPNTGWIAGQLIILHTTNDGLNWVKQDTARINGGGRSVSFVDANTGLIVGIGILRTTDGGGTWTWMHGPTSSSLFGVTFADTSIAIAAGADLTILRTTNGGLNWQQRLGQPNGNDLRAVSFANASTGLVVGDFGDIYLTTTGGLGWSLKGRELPAWPYLGVSMSDVRNATVVGASGRIIHTTNGGFNWSVQISGTTNHLNGVVMIDSVNGWAVGTNGTILHTTNGGLTSIQPPGNEVPSGFNFYQNYPNPFNSKSKIKYQISKICNVKLIIYDVLGNDIETLVNEELMPGTYEAEWDGTNFPSGIYFYKLLTPEYTEARKMILAK